MKVTRMRTQNLLLFVFPAFALLAFATAFEPRSYLSHPQQDDIYKLHRLEKLCSANGSKVRSSIGTEVNVFTFNSSTAGLSTRSVFSCHLELFLPSSLYGFSIFIEEMSLGGSQGGGCRRDYLQFGRDILFLTTHKSRKYCGQVEPPVSTQRKEGVTGFTFPITPLANRIYSEEDDMEMDVWLQIDLANNVREVEDKSLTLVVTPFKKSCASRDLLYRQCRYSTKCVRKELFCDGRINCAWPYSEPADEVYCRETKEPEVESWSMSDLPVIVLVVLLLLAILVGLGCALRRFSSHQEKYPTSNSSSSRQVRHRQGGAALLGRGATDREVLEAVMEDQYRPSCPPLQMPPPYSSLPSCNPAAPPLPRPLHPLPADPPPHPYENPPPSYEVSSFPEPLCRP